MIQSCNGFGRTLLAELNMSDVVLFIWCVFPRGSVIGPILFVLYMTDLITLVKSFGASPQLYAEDTHV